MAEAARGRAAILRPSELPAIDRGGGARTVKIATAARGATSLLNGVTEFEPGAAIPLHWHNCEESVLVLEGAAIVEIDGERTALAAGDVTIAPAETPHRFVNASATERLRIFWTYASIDATRTSAATGETRRIDAETGA